MPSIEPNCTIVNVSNERLNTLLKDKACNIDKLDYLMKRLDSLDNDELQTFYAMAYSEKAETTAELINITFNTHCYSLIADFSDLDAVGRKMYLTEQGAVSEKELQSFDGRAYFEKLLAENPKPRVTPYELLYQNKNPIQTIYDGMHFPLYYWQDEIAEVEVGKDGYSQSLYLPCTQMQIEYVLLRLDADSLSEFSLSLTSDHFLDRMLEVITSEKPLCENIDDINYFASKFREIGTQEESYFEKLMEIVKPNNQKDLKALLDSMYEFELFPNYDKLININENLAKKYLDILFMKTLFFNIHRHTYNYGLLRDRGTGKILSMATNFDNNKALISSGYAIGTKNSSNLLIELFGVLVNDKSIDYLLPCISKGIVTETALR